MSALGRLGFGLGFAWLLLLTAIAGCQRDPSRWQGSQKFLNLHAVSFTARGRGLLLVGPRVGGASQPNATAYYYVDLPTLTARRLGYGQYSLGEALPCPFADWAAIPAYLDGDGPTRSGYALYDLLTGEPLRRVAATEAMFVPHAEESAVSPAVAPDGAAGPGVTTRPVAESESLMTLWRQLTPRALSEQDVARIEDFQAHWLVRGGSRLAGTRIETLDGQAFYMLPSPEPQRRHRLYIRFQAPSRNAAAAADPDGEGYAYGFLLDTQTGRRFTLFDTTGTDEFFDTVGSALVAGPVWLIQQPIHWIRGN